MNMARTDVADVDLLAEELEQTSIAKPSGVTFAGKSLKLNEVSDAKNVIEELVSCKRLELLNFEGNSMGVAAAEEIGKHLSRHPELKQAIWKDMFTGRDKTEIPLALKALGRGVIEAGAQLEVLDLSDNASGPIGVEGFEELLKSQSCYTLKELRLNNMGLGVTGAKMLARALMECFEKSKDTGKPLALKVFIAGRNRLENEGATALAHVFKEIGTLEEICVPQNGINRKGIANLASGLLCNPKLSVLSLNDNTVAKEGAAALAKVLPLLVNLASLDLGDCLLKSAGANFLAPVFANEPLLCLQDINLSFNEIKTKAGIELVTALADKPSIKSIQLNGNQFGTDGQELLKEAAASLNKSHILGSLSEDEEDNEDEEDEESDEDEDEESDEGSDGNEESDVLLTSGISPLLRPTLITANETNNVTGDEFLKEPTADKFMALNGNRWEVILQNIKSKPRDGQIRALMEAIMEVSSLYSNTSIMCNTSLDCLTLECCENLYREMFIMAIERDVVSGVNNTLPIYLGLIKNEDKSNMRKKFNHEGCMKVIDYIMSKGVIPSETKRILDLLMKKPLEIRTSQKS